MDNHRKLPALLEEQLAKIREEARRKLEAELDARRACECAKLAKSRFIPLEEAWFLYGLNPDPEWINHVLKEAARSGDVELRNYPKGGKPVLLTNKMKNKRLQIIGNCISVPDPDGFPDVFSRAIPRARYDEVSSKPTPESCYLPR
jgi:hypothetical protein